MAGAPLKIVSDTTENNLEAEYGFEDAWSLYPKKQARKDAMKAWGQMVLPADIVEVIVSLASWRRVWLARGEDQQYTPLMASWLRGERWTDEVPAAFKNAPASHKPFVAKPEVERSEMPESVRALLAKVRAGR